MAIIRSIEGKEWVMGLEWETYDHPVPRDELRADAFGMEMPWYSHRVNESVIQCGFCKPIDDIVRPRKLASLAAMLADVRQHPWLGIFELGDGLWWYIAIRDHFAIQVGGDVVGTEDEINEAVQRHSGFGGWHRETGTLETLAALVQEAEAKRTKRTPVKSFAVSRIDPVPVAIAAGVFAVMGAIAAIGYHFHAQKALEAKLRAAAAERKLQIARERVPDAHEILARTPTPSEWIQSCGAAISTVPYSQNGWTIAETDCGVHAATIKLQRGPGATVAGLPAGAVASADGNTATLSSPLAGVAARGIDTSSDVETEIRAVQAWAQSHNIAVTIGAPAPISPKIKEGWTVPVTIPMPVSPFLVDAGLDGLPGLRLTGLGPSAQSQSTNSPKATGGTWTLTGVLYARP